MNNGADGHAFVNNERLEYLGDAVLGAVCADILYHHYPHQREGFLTNARSSMVQRSTLGRVAHEMGLEAFIHTAAVKQSHNCFISGNAFEALVGAIYLDRGYMACYRFMEQRVLGRYIQLEEAACNDTNYKSTIIEWCQKHGYPFTFVILEEMKLHEGPFFHCALDICGVRAGEGRGYSKKESHQQAAHDALTHIRKRHAVYREIMAAASLVDNEAEHAEVDSNAATASVEVASESSVITE